MSKREPHPRDEEAALDVAFAKLATRLADDVDAQMREGFREKAEEPDQFALTFLEFIATGDFPSGPAGSTAGAGFYLAQPARTRAAFRAQWPTIVPLLAKLRLAYRRCPEARIAFEDALLPLLWAGMRIQQTIAAPVISSDGYCETVTAGVRALFGDEGKGVSNG